MKKKLSVSIEESVLQELADRVKGGYFRNKSHFVEIALSKYMEVEDDQDS